MFARTRDQEDVEKAMMGWWQSFDHQSQNQEVVWNTDLLDLLKIIKTNKISDTIAYIKAPTPFVNMQNFVHSRRRIGQEMQTLLNNTLYTLIEADES